MSSMILEIFKQRLLVHNKNLLIVAIGATGSGKSYATLRLAERLDPDFNIDRVVFTAQEFFNLVNNTELPPGSVIVFDEAGVKGMAAREAMTVANRVVLKYMESWRCKNICLLMSLPSLNMLDSGIRRLLHVVMLPSHIDRDNKLSYLRIYFWQHNPLYDKNYKKFIRKKVNDTVCKLSTIRLKLPSVKLRHQYENKKELFVDAMAKEALDTLTFNNETKEESTYNKKQIIENVLKEPDKFIRKIRNRVFVDKTLLRHHFNISHYKADEIKKVIEAEYLQDTHTKHTKSMN